MLPFIIFDSTIGSGHGNIIETRKWYIAHRARTKNREVKKEDFSLCQYLKNKEEG